MFIRAGIRTAPENRWRCTYDQSPGATAVSGMAQKIAEVRAGRSGYRSPGASWPLRATYSR